MTSPKMASRIDGKQNPDYFKAYYEKNKEKIAKRNKELYKKRRNTKEGLEKERKRATEYTRKYRKNNPDKVKKNRKSAYNNRKRKAMEMVDGAYCNKCGCNELDFLEFNHINGGGCKEWRENKGVAMMDRVLNGRDVGDLEILCRICNALEYLERKNYEQSKKFKIIWELT